MKRLQDSLVGLISHSAVLRVQTNSERLIGFLQGDPFVRHHIPSVRFEPNLPDSNNNIPGNDSKPYQITFNETSDDPTARFDFFRRRLYVSGMLDRDYEETTFVFNALQFFARMNQEQGLFGIHCGGVTFGTDAVLILGGEEAGKSSVTALLCARFGATYLCDERSLISHGRDSIDWISGNTVLTLRPVTGIYFDIEGLETKFRNVTDASVAKHKLHFQTRSVYDTITPIRHVFFVKLTSDTSEIRKHHHKSAIYKLFAALSEDIHGVWAPILAAGYAMPSLDSEKLCQERLAMALALASGEMNLWTCRGEVFDVCEMILEAVFKNV